MRYGTDDALREMVRRGALLRRRRERMVSAALSGACATFSMLLIACFVSLPSLGGTVARPVPFGAFLLPGEAGGYVLVGVLAFVLGVALVILCLRVRDRADSNRDKGVHK